MQNSLAFLFYSTKESTVSSTPENTGTLIVFVVSDKIGWFGRGLDKSLGVEPFREFDVPVFSGVDKTVDSFVE